MTRDVTLLVMTDGRASYIGQAVASALGSLQGNIVRRVIHDDSGDPAYRAWLHATFPGWDIAAAGRRRGYAGAFQSAWAHVAADPDRPRFVFLLEDDFTFNQPVDVDAMADVLDTNPHVAQMALRRQPWFRREVEVGGVVELDPDAYTETRDEAGRVWLEHQLFWTNNPHLFRASTLDAGWPDGADSEYTQARRFVAEGHNGAGPGEVRFGYWGRRADPPLVHHIGAVRHGINY